MSTAADKAAGPSPAQAQDYWEQEPLRPVRYLHIKAAALLLFTLALILGSALYLLYARGVFEATQQLVLTSDDSEGVSVGMDMTFSGFPIGRVRRIELAPDGNVRIVVDVPRKDAHWLRQSSVFTLVKGLVGGTTIKAYSGIMDDPPLPDQAERPVLRGDATAELPQMMSAAKELLANLSRMTADDSALAGAMDGARSLTGRLQAQGGALNLLMGNDKDAQKVLAMMDRANQVLTRMDKMVARADQQVFDPDGLVPGLKTTVDHVNSLLVDMRASLRKVDAVLQEAQAVGANAREASTDLGPLRTEIEGNLRRLETVLNDLQRKWPFAHQPELKLP